MIMAESFYELDLFFDGLVRCAKAGGAKFSLGSNRHAQGTGEIEYCLRMARSCGLTAKDFFVPSRNLGR